MINSEILLSHGFNYVSHCNYYRLSCNLLNLGVKYIYAQWLLSTDPLKDMPLIHVSTIQDIDRIFRAGTGQSLILKRIAEMQFSSIYKKNTVVY
ncbi:hypothetical protein FHW36_11813 [Chitinophaga polysaccharea]|uniref:Uncharacterized protein n=1 Tax=Chitinophaga polysaccharea TaxID=1293035 RepID=A0A561P0R5_9BACT|nr:hypothetical protein FHW36_11813 [Chitinophaga polysaccharea]